MYHIPVLLLLESVYHRFVCKALIMILCLFNLCLSVLLSRVPTLLVIIFCTVHITPEFIMTMKGFVVKFCEIVLLTFMALSNLNLM